MSNITGQVTAPIVLPIVSAITSSLYGGGGGATLEFHAIAANDTTYEMEGVKVGTGDLTTTHTSSVYAKDESGVYREFGENRPVWAGGRTVESLMRSWINTVNGSATLHYDENFDAVVTLPVGTTSHVDGVQWGTFSNAWFEGVKSTFRLKVKGRAGETVRVMFRSGTSPYTQDYTDVVLTGGIDVIEHTAEQTVAGATNCVLNFCNGVAPLTPHTVTVYGVGLYLHLDGETKGAESIFKGNPVSGSTDLFDENPYLTGIGSVIPYGTNTIATIAGENGFSCTYVDNAYGFQLYFRDSADLTADLIANEYYELTCYAKVSSGASVNLAVWTNTTNGITVDSEDWEPIKIVFKAVGTTSNFLRIQNTLGAGETVYIKDLVLKQADNGARTYANANGATVASGIVTEAVGAALTELPYLQYYPAATNSCLYSRDLTQGWTGLAGLGTRTYDQAGLTGGPNTASKITDSSATNFGGVTQTVTIPADTNSNTLVVYVKKEAAPSSYPAVSYPMGGTVGGYAVDTVNGIVTARSGFSSADDTEVVDAGDWWQILLQTANNSSSSVALALYAAVNTDASGTWAITTTGEAVFGNVELHLNKTIAEVRGLGPIFTEASSVATDATVYSFDATNGDLWNSAHYAEIQTSVDHGDLTDSARSWMNLSGNDQTFWRRYYSGVYPLTSRRGDPPVTAYPRNGGPIPAKDVGSKIAEIASGNDSKFSICVDGDHGLEYTLNVGAATVTSMVLFASTSTSDDLTASKIRNIRRYDIPSYQVGKDTIDGLMSA